MYLPAVAWGLAIATAVQAGQVERRATTSIALFPAASGTPTIESACASISSMSAKQAKASPSVDVTVPPSLALSCLKSVPVDVDNDVALIDYLLPFVSMQSTLEYLKSPPDEYLLPGVDVVGGLQEIRQKLRDGKYTNQYEFTQDVKSVFHAAADGHFSVSIQFNSIFAFEPYFAIASVSQDGLKLPKIYFYADLTSGGEASAISAINGVDINTWLAEFSQAAGGYQDPDAVMNSLFRTIPGTASGEGNLFFTVAAALPDSFKVTFESGKTSVYDNVAWLLVSFDGVESGDDLHSLYGLPTSTSTATATPSSTIGTTPTPSSGASKKRSTKTSASIEGYPEPVVINTNAYISGYYLNSETCVLVLNSFEPSDTSSITDGGQAELEEARDLFESFFSACKKAGRDKLIVDVQANGGGIFHMGLELYRQLFPKNAAFVGNRMRAHEVLNVTGSVLYGTNDSLAAEVFTPVETEDGEPFAGWEALYGPVEIDGSWQTNLQVYNYSDPLGATGLAEYPFIITGSNSSATIPAQPFDKENIVIVTNGMCSSTCTIFAGLMNREAGVWTIAFGGRPLEAPMQAIGGVKGAQMLPASSWQSVTQDLKKSNSIPADLASVYPSAGDAPLQISGLGFNYRNAYTPNGTDGLPLQFIYEAANCKRFYKQEYITNITTLWADAAEVAWGSGLCVSNSTVNADGSIDDKAPAYSDSIQSQQVYNGPGSLVNDEWKALLTNTSGTDAFLGPFANSTNSTNSTSGSDDDKSVAGSLKALPWQTAVVLALGFTLAL